MRIISLQSLMVKRTRHVRLLLLTSIVILGYIGSCMFYPALHLNHESSFDDGNKIYYHHRHLLANTSSGSNYPPDAFSLRLRQQGAVILHVIGMMYMFVALAVVCDEFFVPALSVITERLSISEDVAGATFMAAGGSAPELFTSFIGVFISKSDVGIGTIVGSAVFNILFVIGMCALFSNEVLHLTWWPLFRDVLCYSISLILLIIFFMDESIYWWEALILFLCYIGYVLFMKYNHTAEIKFKSCIRYSKPINKVQSTDQLIEQPERRERLQSLPALHAGSGHYRHGIVQLMIHTIDPLAEGKVHEKAIQLQTVATVQLVINHGTIKEQDGPASQMDRENKVKIEPQIENEEEPLDLRWPDNCRKQVTYVLLAPIIFPLWITMPDVRRPEKKKWFPVTFSVSILWIAIFSYLMVWWANQTGETIGIPDEVMGLTILAAGTSIPDLITSILVAKKGFGDMAVSSSVGSNIFDITVGLPLPWIVYGGVRGGEPYFVSSKGLLCSIILLFLMLIAVIITIAASRWQMSKMLGFSMLILYIIFLTVSVLLEYEIIRCPA